MPSKFDPPFTIVELEQDTDAWRAWRNGGIGASDAPTIMGENPWRSARDLREAKRRASETGARSGKLTPAMARGIKLEPEARRAYNALSGNAVEPACLQSMARDWMRCSLDGICLDRGVAVEIKCGYSAYKYTAKRRKVPRYYYGQVQHTLSVTGFDRMDFFCYLPGRSPILVNCERDESYIEKLIDREEHFWNSLRES